MAVLFGVRPSEVARWPASELRLVEEFLAVEPSAVDRIEIAIAHLHASYVSVHSRKGATPPKVEAFLPYRKSWKDRALALRYSEADMEIIKALQNG